jgi:competence protein ComEA
VDKNYLDKEELKNSIKKISKKVIKAKDFSKISQVENHWRFEFTPSIVKKIIVILLISIIFSTTYYYQNQVRVTEVPSLDIDPVGAEAIAINKVNSEIAVYVSGEVEKPGVYELSIGSRVVDALNVASGLKPKGTIGENNLARLLVDGEQIDFSNQSKTKLGIKKDKTKSSPNCINLNTSTVSELDGLPGVGPVLAQRILDWRMANGDFKSTEQLNDVDGIGKSKFATISAKACV